MLRRRCQTKSLSGQVKGPDRNASRVVAVRLDHSCAWEARGADRIGPGGFGLSTITTNSPALVPPSNPTHAPAINVIADGDFSEEPEKLGLNLHGDPCMTLPGSAVKAACDQFRFSTAIG